MNTDFQTIADDMNRLNKDDKPQLHYELMSDALVWSDEIPKHRRVRELWCLRPVLRYRTGLILGIKVEFENEWLDAKASFPLWIGFYEERCRRSEELENLYHKMKKTSLP